MAISNDKITNRLDKKINFGVARTAKDSVVAPSGEVLSSPLFNPGDTVLIDADQLRGTCHVIGQHQLIQYHLD